MRIDPREIWIEPSLFIFLRLRLTASLALPMERAIASWVRVSSSEPVSAASSSRKAAFLFGGITSSGSSILVQLLAKTPLGMVGSCFAVQFITDYIDRILCLALAAVLMGALRKSMKESFIR